MPESSVTAFTHENDKNIFHPFVQAPETYKNIQIKLHFKVDSVWLGKRCPKWPIDRK